MAGRESLIEFRLNNFKQEARMALYRATEGQKLPEIVAEAAKLRTPDNVPSVTVVMPWLMGDGHPQMIGLDELERLLPDTPSSLFTAVSPMPEGFTDRAAWDAIHWRFSEGGSLLDDAVIGWQRENQKRVKAAVEASRV